MWTLLGMVTIVRIFQILRNFFGCFFYRQTRNIESFEEPSTQVSCTKILSQKKTCELGLGCASYNPILCALPCLAYSASFTGFQLVLCLIDNTFTHNLQPHTFKFIKTMYVLVLNLNFPDWRVIVSSSLWFGVCYFQGANWLKVCSVSFCSI